MATAPKIFPFVFLGLACIPAWGQPKSPQAVPQVNDASRAVPTGSDSAAQPIDPKSYMIGAEDVLHIEVFRDPDYTRSIPVRPDGKITLPLIGDIQAEGLTPERLAMSIKEALSQFENNPEVTISVLAVNSKSFNVAGKVNKVGRWPLATPIRVFDAIGLAGGFQDFADEKHVTIVRGTQRLTFNYKDYVKGKKEALEQNILIQNGDTVLVK